MDYPGKLKAVYIKIGKDSIERILESRDYQLMAAFRNDRVKNEMDHNKDKNSGKRKKILCQSSSGKI